MRHLHLVKKITIHHLVRFDKFRQKEDSQIKNKKSALLPVRNVTLSGSMPCMSTQRTSKNGYVYSPAPIENSGYNSRP